MRGRRRHASLRRSRAGKLIGVGGAVSGGSPWSKPSPRGFLEGDERANLDDAIAPAWYGTGVEDFFDGGFYFDRGAYAAALSGATRVDAAAMPYATSVYRLLLLTDPIVYSSALRLTQEAGSSAEDPHPVCVRSVAYAYRPRTATDRRLCRLRHRQRPPPRPPRTPMSRGRRAMRDPARRVRRTRCRLRVAQPCAASRRAAVVSDSTWTPMPRRRCACGAPSMLDATRPRSTAAPGTTAGSAAADVRIDGRSAGAFSAVIATPARRWQMQEIVLDTAVGAGDLDIEIVPRYAAYTPRFRRVGLGTARRLETGDLCRRLRLDAANRGRMGA